MDVQQFDRIAKLFARRHSRRAPIRGGLVLGVAAAAGTTAGRLVAQDATPAATPEAATSTDPHPSADAPAQPEFLFVQPFTGGTWMPKEEEGAYTLTLSGAPAQTIYFSDRPERIFGLWPTQEFLDNLGFTPANPPNAALIASTSDDADEEVLVIELLNPDYDASTGTLSYEARILADYGEDALAHAARRQAAYDLPEHLGPGGLFIDSLDCQDGCATCYSVVNGENQTIGRIDNVGLCARGAAHTAYCGPCDSDGTSQYYGRLCSEAYPSHCMHRCDGTSCSWDCYATLLKSC